ncbi:MULTISPECIES: cache domain-containing sensor histidine kinase [unclassified Paenibacillus]|uniref:cache domain-containing sensor histidine kinase n=1 Tax=unclassified Paenibacillus TaxID=185978 RepID=UPI003624B4AB
MKGTRSITSTILWRLIPGLIFFVVSTGLVSYILSSEQLKSNAYDNIYDTVSQTKNYLDDRLGVLLTAVVALSNNNSNKDLTQTLHASEEPDYILGPSDYIVLNQAIDQIFTNDYYDMVDSVVLWYNNGEVSFTRTDRFYPLLNFSAAPYLKRRNENSFETVFWKNIHERDLPSPTFEIPKVASLHTWLGIKGAVPRGVFIVNIKESFFYKILNSPKISNNGYLFLQSPDGIMRFKPVEDKYKLNDDELQEKLLHAPNVRGRLDIRNDNGSNMVVIYDTVSVNRWKIAAVYPEEELLSKANYIKYVSFVVMLAAILFALIYSNMLARYISKPIKHLTRQIDRIREGNLNVSVRHWPQYEMVILNHGLHEMVERIKMLLHQVEVEQEIKRQVEISLLQAQIQPHFLYNTLFSIKQLCDMGESEDASRMISALSTFFRISLSKGEEVIPIEQELEQVRTYLFIQQMRYGELFQYKIDVDRALLNDSIVKLTLQPIVENAIYHGIKKGNHPGLIRISGYSADEDIYLYVEDNGAGIEERKLAEIRESLSRKNPIQVGFGILNVHRRLQMMFGSNYGLQYDSEPDSGTIVTIRIRKVHDNRNG